MFEPYYQLKCFVFAVVVVALFSSFSCSLTASPSELVSTSGDDVAAPAAERLVASAAPVLREASAKTSSGTGMKMKVYS